MPSACPRETHVSRLEKATAPPDAFFPPPGRLRGLAEEKTDKGFYGLLVLDDQRESPSGKRVASQVRSLQVIRVRSCVIPKRSNRYLNSRGLADGRPCCPNATCPCGRSTSCCPAGRWRPHRRRCRNCRSRTSCGISPISRP